MGIIGKVMDVIFGGGAGRNGVVPLVEVFRENAEAQGKRELALSQTALAQFAAEFARPRRGIFDRVMDGLNRVPRPALAIGTLGLFGAALYDPVWFSQRMQGLALVPEPLWWLMGAIVSFYFGARHQAKTQEFQRSVAGILTATPKVAANIAQLGELQDDDEKTLRDDNAALSEWRAQNGK